MKTIKCFGVAAIYFSAAMNAGHAQNDAGVVPPTGAGAAPPASTALEKINLTDVELGEIKDADPFKINTSLPDYPALALLGTEDSAITNVATPEDFGAQVLSQFSEDGSLNLGLAVGGSPFWWFSERSISLQEYETELSSLQRILARTTVSLGAIQLDDSDSAMASDGFQTAIGFSTEILNQADPRMNTDLRNCIRGEYNKIARLKATDINNDARRLARQAYIALARETPNAGIRVPSEDLSDYDDVRQSNQAIIIPSLSMRNRFDALLSDGLDRNTLFENLIAQDSFKAGLKTCGDDAARVLQSRQSLRFGGAAALRSDDGDFDNIDFDGAKFWLSYRRPFSGIGARNDGTLSSFGFFAEVSFDETDTMDMEDMMPGMDMMMTPVADDAMAGMMIQKFDGVRAGANINRVRKDFVITGALSYVHRDFESDIIDDQDFLLATVTATYQIRDGLWMEGSFGWSSDEDLSSNEFAGIRLKVDWSRLGVS